MFESAHGYCNVEPLLSGWNDQFAHYVYKALQDATCIHVRAMKCFREQFPQQGELTGINEQVLVLMITMFHVYVWCRCTLLQAEVLARNKRSSQSDVHRCVSCVILSIRALWERRIFGSLVPDGRETICNVLCEHFADAFQLQVMSVNGRTRHSCAYENTTFDTTGG